MLGLSQQDGDAETNERDRMAFWRRWYGPLPDCPFHYFLRFHPRILRWMLHWGQRPDAFRVRLCGANNGMIFGQTQIEHSKRERCWNWWQMPDLLFCWGANDARLHVLISSHYIYLSDPGNNILGACFLGFLAKRFTYFWSANLSLIQHK